MVTLILHGNFVLLVLEVRRGYVPTVFIEDGLCDRWLRQSGVDDFQPQPGFLRRVDANAQQRQNLPGHPDSLDLGSSVNDFLDRLDRGQRILPGQQKVSGGHKRRAPHVPRQIHPGPLRRSQLDPVNHVNIPCQERSPMPDHTATLDPPNFVSSRHMNNAVLGLLLQIYRKRDRPEERRGHVADRASGSDGRVQPCK
ncbi:hypothetical protein D3C73_988820 [compost metagenome]